MNRANKKAPSAFLQRHRCENRNHETRSRSLGGGQLDSVSAVFDSPVIYGVRVETSNPYHLLISNVYIRGRPGRLKQPFRMAASYHEQPGKVKPKFLCFKHFFALLFVQNVHTNRYSRALTIGRASPLIPNKYARRGNLQARAQPHFRANAASQSRALKNP